MHWLKLPKLLYKLSFSETKTDVNINTNGSEYFFIYWSPVTSGKINTGLDWVKFIKEVQGNIIHSIFQREM